MNKRQIMLAAWELFQEKYHYPTTSFKSIGRGLFRLVPFGSLSAGAGSRSHRRHPGGNKTSPRS
jgi:hypothetical protein